MADTGGREGLWEDGVRLAVLPWLPDRAALGLVLRAGDLPRAGGDGDLPLALLWLLDPAAGLVFRVAGLPRAGDGDLPLALLWLLAGLVFRVAGLPRAGDGDLPPALPWLLRDWDREPGPAFHAGFGLLPDADGEREPDLWGDGVLLRGGTLLGELARELDRLDPLNDAARLPV